MWGRHKTSLRVVDDTGGIFVGVVDTDIPLYKSWSDIAFRKRAWYLSYYGSVRDGDIIVAKQPLQFAKGDTVCAPPPHTRMQAKQIGMLPLSRAYDGPYPLQVSVELDMDRGEAEFWINDVSVGRVNGVPDTHSGQVLHIAVCTFKAGDRVEALGDWLECMNPNHALAPKHVSLRNASVHAPAWDIETRMFELEWQNFKLRESLNTEEPTVIKEVVPAACFPRPP